MIRAFLHWWRGCWRLGHCWRENRPISLRGRFAVVAGLWMPAATCTRCPAEQPGVNEQWAEENGYWRHPRYTGWDS
jgi:hypothetical protein